jgi:cytochrome oxidase Cu insertion factor (SCO1/SenC/PrrC family)
MFMPGNGTVQLNDPEIDRLFYRAIGEQILWVVALAIVALIVMILLSRRAPSSAPQEPRARTFLRWAFGTFWVIAGVLQHQGGMPLGLANQVVAPAAAGTPWWVHDLVFDGVGVWNRFPISLAAATMWIELGLGLLLLSSRGTWSRVAAAVTVPWALLVWSVGNGFGGIFSVGASILFGWPGGIVFYLVAAVWLLLPTRVFPETFSKVTLRGTAIVLAGAIVVQVWPDHDFWKGGPLNPLHQMTQSMTQAAQPGWFATVVNDGGRFGSQIGGGLNLIVIFWLAACAVGLWRAATKPSNWPIRLFLVGCVVIWIFAQDAAFFGGLSTDVNSMFPFAALVWCAGPGRRDHKTVTVPLPIESRRSFAYMGGALGIAMVLVAVVPMGRAVVSSGAETTAFLVQQRGAEPFVVSRPAPSFDLTTQHHTTFQFPTDNDKYTVLTFLDPRCYTDCPLLAHQLEDLDQSLTAAQRSRLQIVAIAVDPYHEQVSDLNAFIAKNYLGSLQNFTYVTGPLPTMQTLWRSYQVAVSMSPTAVMSVHSDLMDIISPGGVIRVEVPDDPPSSWAGTQSASSEILQLLQSVGFH